MDTEQYMLMCEQMGWEPDLSKVPKDPSEFSIEVQSALLLFNSLPDNWEGMSGTWMGKDYSGLMDIMDIYEMENRRAVFELFKVAEAEAGKYYTQQKKQAEARSKAQTRR
jgi:hypothetical protein